MKYTLVALLLTVSVAVYAQDGKTPPEPALTSTIYLLDSSNQLTPLEAKIVRLKHKYHGFSGGSSVYEVDGDRSPVRLTDHKPEFAIRLKAGSDPLESVWVVRLGQVGGSRIMPMGDFNALGHLSKITADPTIDFNAAQYGSSSMKITLIHSLAPGEYCLIIRDSAQFPRKASGFCFGLDGESK